MRRLITWIIILSRSDWFSSQNQKCITGSFMSFRIFFFQQVFFSIYPNFKVKKGGSNRLKPVLWLSLCWLQVCEAHWFILNCGCFEGSCWFVFLRSSRLLLRYLPKAVLRCAGGSSPSPSQAVRFRKTAEGIALVTGLMPDGGVGSSQARITNWSWFPVFLQGRNRKEILGIFSTQAELHWNRWKI